MKTFLDLFNLFINTSKQLAAYVPQSGEDVIRMFQQVGLVATNLNLWIGENVGVNLQSMLAVLGRLIGIWFTFLFEAVKNIVNRL
ncbi:MAG: hypothetical protein Q7S73_02405 [bacterium]|nr:hypothetical protein [bacterium]